ncbi:MAG: response regulator [Synergistaceae bacterium]|nr:response regulator [Synergistaceae bacterium]
MKQIMAADRNARVVMCSAIGQEKQIISAIQLGAEDYIVKPFKPDHILKVVGKALG